MASPSSSATLCPKCGHPVCAPRREGGFHLPGNRNNRNVLFLPDGRVEVVHECRERVVLDAVRWTEGSAPVKMSEVS